MNIKFVAIRVSEDENLMYLFYTDKIAFSVDSTRPHLLLDCLQRTFDNIFYLPEEIEDLPKREPRKLLYSFTTHHHEDHSKGDRILKDLVPDIIQDNNTVLIGDIRVECIKTPCHTRDSICILVDNKYMCTGDTIFYLGTGCFFEGTPGDMMKCINKISEYDEDILLLYGHNYKKRNLDFIRKECPHIKHKETERIFLTIKEEKKENPFFLVKNEKELGNLRTKKDNFNKSIY
ncbi:hydroxyacylglutathione hydrolase [Vairimorpha necatrix]|uniref:Hydroxyacylglutathione hydrolase n=1 Tax=Vairimorpha necatrix TaxID=6039 RepID=A0AAX4JEH2_9MICR